MKITIIIIAFLALGFLVWATQDGSGSRSLVDNAQGDHALVSTAVSVLPNAKELTMTRITSKPFRMSPAAAELCLVSPTQLPPHVDHYCHIFVNDIAIGPMNSGDETYKPGSVIVKQKFLDESANDTQLFTIMRKMDDGYDAKHGDWEYSTVGPTGTELYSNGRLESCKKCHQIYKDSDFISRVYLSSDMGKLDSR
jgi:hypothetical protein